MPRDTRAAPITAGQLNRATLERQLLLRRAPIDPVVAVERIAGIQAQEPASPYIALWTRVEGMEPAALDAALQARALVKATLMRVTVHIVSAADYVRLMPAILPWLRGFWQRTRGYRHVELEGIDRLARAALEHASEPRSLSALRDRIASLEPGVPADEVWWRVRRHAPFVHAPGGDPWSFGRRPNLVAAGSWLGVDGIDDEARTRVQEATRHLVSRYLAAFGPASVADMSQWSGLPVARLRPAIEAMADLVRYRDDGGRSLIDLSGASIPTGDEPAPPRLLPMWDSTVLAYADRRRIISDEHRKVVIARNGDTLPTFLVDGRVAGLWWAVSDAGRTRIDLEPFGRLSNAHRRELEQEAERLASFLEPREPDAYRRYRRHTLARVET